MFSTLHECRFRVKYLQGYLRVLTILYPCSHLILSDFNFFAGLMGMKCIPRGGFDCISRITSEAGSLPRVLGPLLECLSVKSLQGSLALDYADNAGWMQEADVQPTCSPIPKAAGRAFLKEPVGLVQKLLSHFPMLIL